MKVGKFALILSIVAGMATTGSACFAICPGASSELALENFNKDPTAFMKSHPDSRDMADQITALAAAAVNARNKFFGKNLGVALGAASGDQGKAVGGSLGKLGASCSDPLDPADRGDKAYISTNIAPNILTNVAANAAYGLSVDGGTQTAAVGGGGGGGAGGAPGGGGSGVGGQIGSTTTTGGSSGTDNTPQSTPTANTADSFGPVGAGSVTTGGSTGGTNSSTTRLVTRSTVLVGATSNP